MNERFLADLIRFFKAARHLWGRCPHCDQLFRMSEVAISFGGQPPRDWLRRLERREATLREGEDRIGQRESGLFDAERQIGRRERDMELKERSLERIIDERARVRSRQTDAIQAAVREARAQALQRSRSIRLGKLFERLWPFRQKLDHDPRDMRVILDPIDYVVFHGLTTRRRVDRITFIEVKSGASRPTPCQNSIRDAVVEKRVDFKLCQIDG